MAMLSREAIERLGFSKVGDNVLISEKASIYNASKISIGNNVRIDDFAVLSAGNGGITIGNHVHIALGVSLIGSGKITLSDFCGISSRVSIYSSNDDYSGVTMTGPTLSTDYTNVTHADVFVGKHVVVGSGSVILPGITLEEGAIVGALSFVSKDCKAFGIYVGTPAKYVKERKRDLLQVEQQFILNSKLGSTC